MEFERRFVPGRRAASPDPWILVIAALWLLLACFVSACSPSDPLEEIRQLQARGDYAETIQPLREVLEERPDDPEAHYLYGMALMGVGEYGAATWALREAMEDPEWRQAAAMHLIRGALMSRDFAEVVRLTDRLLDADPDDALALLYRAQANAYWKQDLEGALADARRVLELEPDLLEAYEPMIISLLELERIGPAREALAEAGRRLEETESPESAMGWHCSTTAVIASTEDFEGAVEVWEDCLDRYPADPSVVADAVEYFEAAGDTARALEILQTAHEMAPREWSFRVPLAHRLARDGDRPAAEALLQEAAEVEDPRVAHAAWLDLAQLRHSVREHGAAAAAIEKAIDRLEEVEAPRAHDRFSLADALVVSGQLDRALEVAEQILVPAQKALILGRVAQERGEPEAALEYFDEALRMWPDNPWAHYYAAMAAEGTGRFERALEEYRWAIRINPSATDARTRAAQLLAAQGKFQTAYGILFLEAAKHPLEREGEIFGIYLIARVAIPAQLQHALLQKATEHPEALPEALAAAAEGVAERAGPASAVTLLRDAPIIDYTKPSSVPALRALVRYAHGSAQPEIAQDVVDRALAAAPDAPEFQGILGLHLELGGADPEGALAAYERAVAGSPRDTAALQGLARQIVASDPGRSGRLLDRAAAADPSDPIPKLDAARLLRHAGQPALARERLEALLRAHPLEAAAAGELVEIDLAEGAVSERTLAWARRALRSGTDLEALERLARVHGALGNEAEEAAAAARAESLREHLAARGVDEAEGEAGD